MPRKIKMIFGPPGTGKTTTLLNIVEQHIDAGVASDRIAFVTFTKKAATEASERATEKFKLKKHAFVNFRTLHSTAYHALCVSRDEVMNRADYKRVAKMLGVEFSGYVDPTEGVNVVATEGDMMLNLINYSGATGDELKKVWSMCDEPMDWFKLKQFRDTLATYKDDTGKLDFDDMLAQFTAQRLLIDVDVAIIDEAQDLSNAQWDMVKVAFRKAKHVYIAGDDDQAIYEWSGANVSRFLNISADRTVLPTTYRLPKKIQALAQVIAGRISDRYSKEWATADDREGKIHRLAAVDNIEITDGTWMLISRNTKHLEAFTSLCNQQGIPYTTKKGPSVDPEHLRAIKTWENVRANKKVSEKDWLALDKMVFSKASDKTVIWHDALVKIPLLKREYYLSILRSGRKLTDCANVYIGTIHSVKGGEADNVVLLTDMSYKTAASFEDHPDPEHRCFYVGVTRTKNALYLVDPQGQYGYKI